MQKTRVKAVQEVVGQDAVNTDFRRFMESGSHDRRSMKSGMNTEKVVKDELFKVMKPIFDNDITTEAILHHVYYQAERIAHTFGRENRAISLVTFCLILYVCEKIKTEKAGAFHIFRDSAIEIVEMNSPKVKMFPFGQDSKRMAEDVTDSIICAMIEKIYNRNPGLV